MNSYEQLIDRFDTFQKGMDGFGTVAGAYKDEILSVCKDEISSVQKDGKEQEHSQDKEIAAKLQEIIIAMKDMELRLNQTIMNSQKVVVSQPQVSVPVATPVEPQPAPQNHVEEIQAEPEISPEPEPEISPEPEESMEPEPEISPEPEESDGTGAGDFTGAGRKYGAGPEILPEYTGRGDGFRAGRNDARTGYNGERMRLSRRTGRIH